MPIQGPQWTEFLTCPICLSEFNRDRGPVSLSCGHTICKTCLQQLHRKRCPFDQVRDSAAPPENQFLADDNVLLMSVVNLIIFQSNKLSYTFVCFV